MSLTLALFVNSNNSFAGGGGYPDKWAIPAKGAVVDDWRMYNRECTSFVAWKLSTTNGYNIVRKADSAGRLLSWNANLWNLRAQELGAKVDNTPAVGSVAWWSSGHVAWVSSINGNTVTIEEYNYNYNGNYNVRTINKSNPDRYIHFKDLQPTDRWSAMQDPRVMVVKQNTLKVYADSMELDDNWLTVGQQIMFESKTVLGDGQTCLRTRIDTQNNVPRCVLMKRLDEFTPQFSLINNGVGELLATTQGTCKVNLRNITASCEKESVNENTVITMVASTEIMGTTYYITQHDWNLGIRDRGMLAERFRPAYVYESIQLIPMKATTNTAKYIPGTDIVKQTIDANLEISFSSKITLGDKTFYRTAHDTSYNNNLVIPGDQLTPNFSPLMSPRNFKTVMDTVHRNVLSGQVCSSVAADTVLFIDTKIKVGAVDYFRTNDNTAQDSLCAIDLRDLVEM
jgi:surface antigen